jgi:hypothetical protein
MDVNYSNCIHCNEWIHYSQARLLPDKGGVCFKCAEERGYRACEECQDYFIPEAEDQHFCDTCMTRIFKQFI